MGLCSLKKHSYSPSKSRVCCFRLKSKSQAKLARSISTLNNINASIIILQKSTHVSLSHMQKGPPYRVSRFQWTDLILCGCLSPKKHELRAWKSLGNWFDDSFLTASTMRLILSSGFCIRNRTTIYRAITKSGHKNRKYRGFTRITMGQYRAQ